MTLSVAWYMNVYLARVAPDQTGDEPMIDTSVSGSGSEAEKFECVKRRIEVRENAAQV